MKLKRYLSDWFYERKYRRQRVKRKYSDDMCWDLNYTLLDILPDMIENLRQMKHSYPDLKFEEVDNMPKDWVNIALISLELEFSIFDYEKPSLDDAFTRWHIILKRMAYCLREADKDIPNKYEEEYNKASMPDTSNAKTFKQYWNTITEPIVFGENEKPRLYVFKTKKVDERISKKYFDEQERIENYKDDMKTEAFTLINKYFWNLWD